MSLVEIMIAVFVLGVGLLALASTAITSIVNLRVSQGRQQATDAASAFIEDLRRTDYAGVALDATDPSVQDFVSAISGCIDTYGEPVVTTNQPGALAREQPFGPDDRITVTTTVSWYDEGDDDSCTDADHDRDVKRVQVVAEWDDGGRTFSVQESTLIAPVDRGLPVPDFRLGTPESTLVFTEDDKDNGRERCVGHVLRNLGGKDGYEWTATRTDSGSVEKNNAAQYWTADSRFYLRAFFENPAQDPPLDPVDHGATKGQIDRHAGLPSGLELMVDDADGNVLPDTETKLETGEQARLWICYWPGSNADVGDSAEFDVTVSSQFDPNRAETVHHRVEVADDFTDLYLFDDYPGEPDGTTPTTSSASGDRIVQGNGNNEDLPALPMGPETTLQPELIGATSELPNYDTDFDTHPGTRLLDAPRTNVSEGAWPASTIAFHEQVTVATTFGTSVRLDLWSASQAALEAEDAGQTSIPSTALDYEVSLKVLKSNEKAVDATVFTETFTDTSTAAGFHARSVNFTLPNGFTVDRNQYLRLEIRCVDADEICHLAYDQTNHPAKLRLQANS